MLHLISIKLMSSKPRLLGALLISFALFFASCSAEDSQSGFSDTQETQKVSAAKSTATTNSNCTAIAPFYWEIGNVSSILVSGSTGDGSVKRSDSYAIGSATKWLFGAYVLEYRAGAPNTGDIPYLTMTSGYSNFTNGSCTSSNNVRDCFIASTNDEYDADTEGKFYYNGGHFQAWANEVGGMSDDTSDTLSSKFKNALGSNTNIKFETPQLAGGAKISAAGYAEFLKRIISGQLKIKKYLGINAVCTLPGSSNCDAESSPLSSYSLAFHYSYGHWVEDADDGDDSFSSPGTFGFYPWIDSTKKYYGIISRYESSTSGSESNEVGNGYASYLCGKAIRKAYISGTAQ